MVVKRPHMIGTLSVKTSSGHRGYPGVLALSAPRRYAYALLTHRRGVRDAPSLLQKHGVGATIDSSEDAYYTTARAAGHQSLVIWRLAWLIGGVVLMCDLARPPLGEPRRSRSIRIARACATAQKILFAISVRATFSGSLPTMIRLSLVLALQVLQALHIVGLHAAELRSPAVIGRL